VRIVRDYFKDQTLVTPQNVGIKSVTIGVPQGLVLGPLLWNIMNDALLRLDIPSFVLIIGFADDMALVAIGENQQHSEDSENVALECVTQKAGLH